jgi:UDP-glucose 4-epimerase
VSGSAAPGTVLVTGAGQIGCWTAAQLRTRDERVLLVDLRAPSKEVVGFAGLEGVTFETADVTDFDRLDALCEAFAVDRVVHTAALLSSPIRADPLAGVRVNALGTANVLDLARRRQMRRVVLASSTTVTSSVFGSFRGAALPEDFPMRALSESPGSIYSASKLFAEHLALLYARLYGLSVVALRYAAVIGPWPGPVTSVPGRLFEGLIEPARAGREAVLDDPLLVWQGIEEFVDARDCARSNLAALDAPQAGQTVYHVTSGETFTFDEVVAAVRVVYPGLKVSVRAPAQGGFAGFAVPRPAPSNLAAARRDLAFSPEWRLVDTIRSIAAARTATTAPL